VSTGVSPRADPAGPMRKLKQTLILNDPEVGQLAAVLRTLMGERVMELADAYGVDVESTLRFGAVAEKCRKAREERGLSLKDAATTLKVPQYRLKAIEASHVQGIDAVVLKLYVEFLGLERWLGQWARHNRALHARLIRNPR
jgi:hypothetical protein